jgi:hypothetical protein
MNGIASHRTELNRMRKSRIIGCKRIPVAGTVGQRYYAFWPVRVRVAKPI